MNFLIFAPLGLQALAIFIDEFYFHHRRGLPKWERLGHPADTLSVLACYLFILFSQATSAHVIIYFALSLFSSLLITKDEFVHKEHCPGGELWLHSILFILHPVSFLVAGLIWAFKTNLLTHPFFANIDIPFLWGALELQTALVGVFALYQIIYWNLIWKKKSA